MRFNNVRAAIKLQFRDVDSFIHRDWRTRTDIRYIKKTLATQLSDKDYATLLRAIRESGCIPMSTPFDEASVDLCGLLDVPIIKLASSDINDWFLIEKIATLKKPVIASTGGSSLKDIDDLVTFFGNRNIPLALNHCVSLYPSEHRDLELNQIDFLKARYPETTIGLSTHEYRDWSASMLIAYAKGARTFERHIDIDEGGVPVSPILLAAAPDRRLVPRVPSRAGNVRRPGTAKRLCSEPENKYLDSLVRGVYARHDLPARDTSCATRTCISPSRSRPGSFPAARPCAARCCSKDGQGRRCPCGSRTSTSPYAHHEGLKQHIYARGF